MGKKKSNAIITIVPVAVLCAVLARCNAGMLGLGIGPGFGPGNASANSGAEQGSADSGQQDSALSAEDSARTSDDDSVRTSTDEEASRLDDGAQEASRLNAGEDPARLDESVQNPIEANQNAGAASDTPDSPEPETPPAPKEYTIEIKKDGYYIDGMEITAARLEAILQEENTIIKIDNNYGSQKAVTELKELFRKYDQPYIE